MKRSVKIAYKISHNTLKKPNPLSAHENQASSVKYRDSQFSFFTPLDSKAHLSCDKFFVTPFSFSAFYI